MGRAGAAESCVAFGKSPPFSERCWNAQSDIPSLLQDVQVPRLQGTRAPGGPWRLPVQTQRLRRRVRRSALDTVPSGRGRAGVLGATGNPPSRGPAAPRWPHARTCPGPGDEPRCPGGTGAV